MRGPQYVVQSHRNYYNDSSNKPEKQSQLTDKATDTLSLAPFSPRLIYNMRRHRLEVVNTEDTRSKNLEKQRVCTIDVDKMLFLDRERSFGYFF